MAEKGYLHQALPGNATVEVPIDEDQVRNTAGGFVWQTDPFMRLRRFLILGTEGGTYYVSERDLTMRSITSLAECVREDGKRTVEEIVAVSKEGRAPKNDPAIFALAYCAGNGDDETRAAALDSVNDVCRIGTHLFLFCDFVQAWRGWGPALVKAVARWYEERNADSLGLQVAKYRNRHGWTHSDVLALAHPDAPTDDHKIIYDWIQVHGRTYREPTEDLTRLPRLLDAYERLQGLQPNEAKKAAEIVRETGAPRELVQSEHLNSIEVWDALLERMPVQATIRNLGNMSQVGLLAPMSDATRTVEERITNEEILRQARVHPLTILGAMTTYQTGQGVRGRLTWTPVQSIVDSLDEAFYMAFPNVEPTGKRYLLGIDVSSSMAYGEVSGIPGLTPALCAAAMALVIANTEKEYEFRGFAGQFVDLPISPKQRLTDALREVQKRNFGSTNCALPMKWAMKEKREVDFFAVFTDSETWVADIHPSQAVKEYRKKFVDDARLCVVSMTANDFTIADPNDPGMLDVVGFDTSTPTIMAGFAKGEL